jgi:two-component system phosphate regulon sensor histidine kinase PhoR
MGISFLRNFELPWRHKIRKLETKIQNLKTEREEQATLMSAISDAILAVDPEEAPLFYNSRFALLFGNQKVHPHQRLSEIFRDPDILAAFRNTLKSGQSGSVKAIPMPTAMSMTLSTEDPSDRRFFSLSVSPLRQAQNLIYGAVGVFHDVTDLKRAEQIRIDFVANVSHELRTPLTAIKGYADTLLLDCKQSNPVVPEFLEVIVRNSDRLMNLINDLLDLSSLESKDTLQMMKVSTEEVTLRILKQLKKAFEAKEHQLSVKNQAPFVLADPRRLEQVLVNLLDNANKYTPAEGKIWIHWEPMEKSTLLTIRNSGHGIPPEHHSRLFERFYRVDKARSREQGGTGLGLAIVKHIMQRHDGSVWVESRLGNETAFVCQFPN